jgi:hypothetical protein
MTYLNSKLQTRDEIFDPTATSGAVWPGDFARGDCVYLRFQPEGAPFSVQGHLVSVAMSDKGRTYDVAVKVDSREQNGDKSLYAVIPGIPEEQITSINAPDEWAEGALESIKLDSVALDSVDAYAAILAGAHQGAMGHNTQREPTVAQREAGNYKMGRIVVQGMSIAIENPQGTYRTGVGSDGKRWTNRLAGHYGYLERTKGRDGDGVDVFVGPYPESNEVFVINQLDESRHFDEHKVMIGYPDSHSAESAYKHSFSSDWKGLGNVIPVTVDQFKWWLRNGNTKIAARPEHFQYETEQAMDSILVKWTGDEPLGTSLAKVLYRVRAADPDGLLLDGVTIGDVLEEADMVLEFDALVVPYFKLERTANLLMGAMKAVTSDVKPVAAQVSMPFMRAGVMQIVVVIELSDGQTVAVYFHNPDSTPKKASPTDEMISWKWLLNKKDMTIAVAPERGADLNIREVARRVVRLADRNSAGFVAANAKRSERFTAIETAKSVLAEKQATLGERLKRIDVLEFEAREREMSPAKVEEPVVSASVETQEAPIDAVTPEVGDEVLVSGQEGQEPFAGVVTSIKETAGGQKVYVIAEYKLSSDGHLQEKKVREGAAVIEVTGRDPNVIPQVMVNLRIDAAESRLREERSKAKMEAAKPKFEIVQADQMVYIPQSIVDRMNEAEAKGEKAMIYRDAAGKTVMRSSDTYVNIGEEGGAGWEQGPSAMDLASYLRRNSGESVLIAITSELRKEMADRREEIEAKEREFKAEKIRVAAKADEIQSLRAEMEDILEKAKFKKTKFLPASGAESLKREEMDADVYAGVIAVHRNVKFNEAHLTPAAKKAVQGFDISHVETGLRVLGGFATKAMAKLAAARFAMGTDLSLLKKPDDVRSSAMSLFKSVVMAVRAAGNDPLTSPEMDIDRLRMRATKPGAEIDALSDDELLAKLGVEATTDDEQRAALEKQYAAAASVLGTPKVQEPSVSANSELSEEELALVNKVDAAYAFADATPRFKAWVSEGMGDEGVSTAFDTAKRMDETAKGMSSSIKWDLYGESFDAVFDGVFDPEFSLFDGVEGEDFVGKILVDDPVIGVSFAGRIDLGGDGKAMVFLGESGSERAKTLESKIPFSYSDDDAPEMVESAIIAAKKSALDSKVVVMKSDEPGAYVKDLTTAEGIAWETRRRLEIKSVSDQMGYNKQSLDRGNMDQAEFVRRNAAQAEYAKKQYARPLTDSEMKVPNAIIAKDPIPLVWAFVNNMFETSEKVFAEATGVKVSRLNRADKTRALFDWAGWTPEMVQAHNEAFSAKRDEAMSARKVTDMAVELRKAWEAFDGKSIVYEGNKTTFHDMFATLAAEGRQVVARKRGAVMVYSLVDNVSNLGVTIRSKVWNRFLKAAIDAGGLAEALNKVGYAIPSLAPKVEETEPASTPEDDAIVAKLFQTPTERLRSDIETEIKALGGTVEWSDKALDSVADSDEPKAEESEEDDLDEGKEWDACPTEDEDQTLDGDFQGHPFRGNQYKKSTVASGAAVHASIKAKHSETHEGSKNQKSAHRTAYHAHMAAANGATGKAKRYHSKMATFHGARALS